MNRDILTPNNFIIRNRAKMTQNTIRESTKAQVNRQYGISNLTLVHKFNDIS